MGEFLIAANSPKHGRASVVPPLTEPLEGENAWRGDKKGAGWHMGRDHGEHSLW